MNIVVSTAAARTSGALTIYNQFLTHLSERRDGNRYLLFVDREMPHPAMDGVEYADVDLRSWSRRILFDASGCRELCEARGVRPDVLVSLQNTGVRYPGVPQVIYYHNSLPFYPRRWNPLRREERPLFLYAWMYPLFVRASLPAGVEVVVQIPFIRRGFVRRYGWPAERVHVLFPDVEEVEPSTVADYPFEPGCAHFVYPARDFAYKEHRTLLEALKAIRRTQPELAARIRIHLTVAEGQNRRFEAAAATGGVGTCFVRHGYVSFPARWRRWVCLCSRRRPWVRPLWRQTWTMRTRCLATIPALRTSVPGPTRSGRQPSVACVAVHLGGSPPCGAVVRVRGSAFSTW